MESKSLEIICAACGQDTLLVRAPKYDGFKKAGETLRCASCGHEYATEEEVPFKQARAVRVFTEEDRPRDLKVFAAEETGRLCRHCVNYVLNPFMQWCSRHRKEVQATDSCGDFAKKPDEPAKPAL